METSIQNTQCATFCRRRRRPVSAKGRINGRQLIVAIVATVWIGSRQQHASTTVLAFERNEGQGKPSLSPSSPSSFAGLPTRKNDSSSKNSLSKRGSSTVSANKDLDSEASPILSSPFLDSFQEEVHEIVSGYRSEVRDTFKSLTRDMMADQDRRRQRQKEREEALLLRANEGNSSVESKTAKEGTDHHGENENDQSIDSETEDDDVVDDDEVHVEGERPPLQEHDAEETSEAADEDEEEDDNWDDMIAPLSDTDTEADATERFDIFSDLAGGEGEDESNDFLVGDTDEDEDHVVERLRAAPSTTEQEDDECLESSAPDPEETAEPLDPELVHSAPQKRKTAKASRKKRKESSTPEAEDHVEPPLDEEQVQVHSEVKKRKSPKKKAQKKKPKKKKRPKTAKRSAPVATELEPIKGDESTAVSTVGSSAVATTERSKTVQTLRSLASSAAFAALYVIMALVFKTLTKTLTK